MTRAPFPSREDSRTSKILEIIHSDVCGPISTTSNGGSRYFVTFIDDFSKYCEVHFMKQKNEVLQKFKDFQKRAERSTGNKIINLQSDNEVSEYCNKEFDKYLRESGIHRRLAAKYTPQQNGLAERKNRTLIEKARCLLAESNLPQSFWAEAVATANYLCNRSPNSSINGEVPYQRWTGRTPSVRHLQVFGSKAHVLKKRPNFKKFDVKTTEGIFVGYSEFSKAYRIWLPSKEEVETTRDVKILNQIFYEKRDKDDPQAEKDIVEIELKVPIEDNLGEQTDFNHLNSNEIPGHSKRTRKPPVWTQDYILNEDYAFSTTMDIEQVFNSDEHKEWDSAIKDELKAHLKNGTWKIVDMKNYYNVIGSKMVLKNKLKPNGDLERRKARLVARGFSQRPGIDYDSTFAPVAKLSSIRYLLGLAVEQNLSLHQLDISTAYLNGDINEELYMQVPNDLERYLGEIMVEESDNNDTYTKAADMLKDLRSSREEKVCRLQKALYGLKQSGRQWFSKLDAELQKLGCRPSNADPCVYFMSVNDDIIIVCVYVDDIIVACSDASQMTEFKKKLMNVFEMRDLGELNYCLGIQFERKNNYIYAHQSKYIEEILLKFNMSNCKPVKTPMEPGLKLAKSEIPAREDLPYQNLIGSLMYLAVGTRPNIIHAVSSLSQFNTCFSEDHWNAAKRVLRYLQGTKNLALAFTNTKKDLYGMADADWAGCQTDRRSYSGYCFKFGGSLVSWESRKQRSVALSTAEAEYMSLTEAAKEAMHLTQLSTDLGSPIEKIKLYSDNQAAKNLAENPIISSRSKHIKIREHFIRDAVQNGEIEIHYKPSEEMEADIFTKALAGQKYICFRNLLGLVDLISEKTNRRS